MERKLLKPTANNHRHQKSDPGAVCVCVFIFLRVPVCVHILSLFRWAFVCVFLRMCVSVSHFGGSLFSEAFVTIWFSFPEGWFPLPPPTLILPPPNLLRSTLACRYLLFFCAAQNWGVPMQIVKHIALCISQGEKKVQVDHFDLSSVPSLLTIS